MLDFMLDQKMLSRPHLLPLAGSPARLDDMLADFGLAAAEEI